MSHPNHSRTQSQRQPLSDATGRLNNSRHPRSYSTGKQNFPLPHHESLEPNGQLPISDSVQDLPVRRNQTLTVGHDLHPQPLGSSPVNNRSSAVSGEPIKKKNRHSQISTTSTTGSDGKNKRKTHIGPWHLGKTLGQGSTARVRLARHAITGQPAAIKIVPKENAKLSQAGSLASLDRKDGILIENNDGFRKMPYGIEREIAIMKLIDHPHIMKLYDIWENRTEM
jgi:serine/threonine-protein kinase HSL1 (negative regulator of Swe1 kinase)